VRWAAAALLVLLAGCGEAPSSADAGVDAGPGAPPLTAGVATVDITPAPGIDLVGFGTRPSSEVRDPLEAAVLVLRRGAARLALVTLDLPGLSDWYGQQLRARVASALGLGLEAVIAVASHTHSAPMLGDDPWSAATLDAIVAAAERAAADPVAVEVALAEGAIDFDVNRRLVVDGVAEARPNPDGPRDPRVRPLVLRAGAAPIALVSHVVCHANLLLGPDSPRISADFVGEARERLRAAHGAPWLFVPGAAGDVRPATPVEDGEFVLADDADLERVGADLADAVDASLAGAAPIDDPTLAAADVSWSAPTRDGGTRPLDLVAWRIGSLAIVTIPGEPVVRIGQRTEAALLDGPPTDALVVGYANGYASYLVTPEDEPYGGYEVARASLTADASVELEAQLTALAAPLW